jgi:heavy metal sensor kinase
MSLRKGSKIFGTLTLRLTLWYAALFSVLSLAVFIIFYLTLSSNLMQRMDHEITDDAVEIMPVLERNSLQEIREYVKGEEDSKDADSKFFLVLSPGLEVVASTDLTAWEGLEMAPAFLRKLKRGQQVIRTISVPGHESKVRVIYKKVSDGSVIHIGTSLEDDEELLESLQGIFGTTAIAVLLFGCLLGWFIARRAMSGVERVREAAVQIGQGDLTSRVPVGNEGEEIKNLAIAFNEMIERIDALIKEIKEVAHNIAHDLRGPLTRIRGICETTLSSHSTVEDYQEMVGTVINESDRLVGMINTLLEIAETEAGVAPISKVSVDINELARNAYELFLPVAEDRGVHLDLEAAAEPLVINGDVSRLQRMVANLLDNAIKYTPAGGRVSVSVKEGQEQVIVAISDSGIGIDEKSLPRIFERFYRGDESRSTPGNGLGLSLVGALVHAHGGEIQVESSPGKGTRFTVVLPKVGLPLTSNITKK